MESADLGDGVTCSICKEIYRDPVTLECGHSFCQECISRAFDSQEDREYFCPLCMKRFIWRPELKKNISLCKISEYFHQSQPEGSSPRIVCSYCVHTSMSDVKQCLRCEAYLCDIHLGTHSKSPEHVLTDPTDQPDTPGDFIPASEQHLSPPQRTASSPENRFCPPVSEQPPPPQRSVSFSEDHSLSHVTEKPYPQRRASSSSFFSEKILPLPVSKQQDTPRNKMHPVHYNPNLTSTAIQNVGSPLRRRASMESRNASFDVNTAGNYSQMFRSESYTNQPETPRRIQLSQGPSIGDVSTRRHNLEMEVGGIGNYGFSSRRVVMGRPSLQRSSVHSVIGGDNNSWGSQRIQKRHSVMHGGNI